MKTKIMNWLENHETVCGVALLVASVCTAAFSGAYIGASTTETNNNFITVNVYGYMNDAISKENIK